MGSAARRFPGPACACDKSNPAVRTNGLGIGGKRRASCASGGLNQHLQVVSIGKTSAAVWRAASEGRNLNVSRWRERAVAIELFSGKWRKIVMTAKQNVRESGHPKVASEFSRRRRVCGRKRTPPRCKEERENLPRKGRFLSNCEGIRKSLDHAKCR